MGPFGIELIDESVEAPLLTTHRRCGRAGCFLFEGLVHPLVASVLRWPAWLDELGKDPQPNPPDRQSTQSADGCRRKRGAVIGADDSGKPEFLEDSLEDRLGTLVPRGIQTLASEQIPAEAIGYRERVAIDAIAGLEFALEISTPNVVGSCHRGFRLSRMPWMSARTLILDQPVTLEQVGNRRSCRPTRAPMAPREYS